MKAMRAPVVEMAARDEPGADAEHDRVADVAEELHEGEVRGHEPLRRGPGSRGTHARGGGTGRCWLLVDEGLGLADARQAFLEIGVHDGDAVPCQFVGRAALRRNTTVATARGRTTPRVASAEIEVEEERGRRRRR